MGSIDLEIKDKIGTIIINNPSKMNCLDMSMLGNLDAIIQQIPSEKSVNAVQIIGAGEKAFSTGANLKEFGNLDERGTSDWIRYGNKVFNDLEALPIPSLAVINGYALGGGLELALACDLRIATENSQFAFPELKHGWIPGWGGLSRLRRLIGESKAKQLIMLGEMIDGKSALEMGIINKLSFPGEIELEALKAINHLKEIDPFLMEITKNALMDSSKGTTSNDRLFDVLATIYSKNKK